MQRYAGSVAASAGRIAITSPRGGAVMLFGESGAHLGTHRGADVCRVAPAGDDVVLTVGLARLTGEGLTVIGSAPAAWDNHIVALTA